jgi:hypothetical protein
MSSPDFIHRYADFGGKASTSALVEARTHNALDLVQGFVSMEWILDDAHEDVEHLVCKLLRQLGMLVYVPTERAPAPHTCVSRLFSRHALFPKQRLRRW